MRRPQRPRLLLLLVLAAALYASREAGWLGGLPGLPGWSEARSSGDERLLDAFQQGESGIVLELSGTVEKVLSDDRHGSRHQRFVLRLASGHTVLVTHNIDLAPRIQELGPGDPVALRGQYEWNERGGVVHWTHHDPSGRRPGGWIRHRESVYR